MLIKEDLPFLSQEWIHEVTKVVQGARSKDEEFKKLTSNFSLNLLYVITDLPPALRLLYSDQHQVQFFIQLEKGAVRKLRIGTEFPAEKIDFTVASSYSVTKQIFTGEISLATAFINREFKVEPLSKVYSRPRFTAKSIVAGNRIFKIARQVSTMFVPDRVDGGSACSQESIFQGKLST